MSNQWPRYRRPGTDDVERESRDSAGRPLREPPGPPASPAPTTRRRRRGGRRLGSVVALVAAFGLVRVFGGGGAGEQEPDPLPAEERYEAIATTDGLAELGAALTAATGSAQVLELRTYGVDDVQVTVPPAADGDLAEVWRWDGSVLEKWMGEQVGDDVPFALADLDAAVLVAVDEEARRRSDGDISDSRIRVRKPTDAYGHWLQAHVDEVDHGGVTLWADLDGKIESELVNKSWRDD